MEYSNLFVCLMGICTVFIGLVCIIILVTVMSGIIRKAEKRPANKSASNFDPSRATDPVIGKSRIPDYLTPEFIAAVSVAIAEDMGTDVGAIRIRSINKV